MAYAWTSTQLLDIFGKALWSGPSAARVDLEFSIRLRDGHADYFGRFGFWVNGGPEDAARIDSILEHLAAPPEVRLAVTLGTVRLGIAVSLTSDPEFRLYLHGKDALCGDTYTAFRWRSGEAARRCIYHFHYAPESAEGEQPERLVHPYFRDAAAQLARAPRFRQASGFWLRSCAEGSVDQVDFAFPWSPRAGTLAGLVPILAEFSAAESDDLAACPVRHVAFPTATGDACVTLYCSGAAQSDWPRSEVELQAQARTASAARHDRSDALILGLIETCDSYSASARALDNFYGGRIDHWQAVLGPEMHYHHGLFDSTGSISASPDAMARAMRRAVTELYSFIPPGGSIYDVGCGWGGPMSMLIRDLGCSVLGLTISRTQFRYIAGLGLPVRWGDAERTLPPREFDCALLLESFEHVQDKARLLQLLRPFVDRLVMRVNCQDRSPECAVFAGTMQMVSSTALRRLVEAAGWRVKHWRNRRNETMLTHEFWYHRLRELPPGVVAGDPHLQEFRAWCVRVLANRVEWAENNPLIELIAD
ncbi:SAM-dependent methyltransferase [Chitinimonas arctica]|uniref:SAM-dependent methyltransferase n=1 Tax=Chitinimonas arctica TaxID=2594795 RepID=UPI0015D1074F|nr:class I SAM-dependent methyltransferase [Chitinimonas arctica]